MSKLSVGALDGLNTEVHPKACVSESSLSSDNFFSTRADDEPVESSHTIQNVSKNHVNTTLHTQLSERELQVLRHLALGCSDKAIAQRLHISIRTVHFHVERITSKLSAQNRIHAVVIAMQTDILRLRRAVPHKQAGIGIELLGFPCRRNRSVP